MKVNTTLCNQIWATFNRYD